MLGLGFRVYRVCRDYRGFVEVIKGSGPGTVSRSLVEVLFELVNNFKLQVVEGLGGLGCERFVGLIGS